MSSTDMIGNVTSRGCGRWRGEGAVLDVTSSAAVTWFSDRLRQFSEQFGVDSFKFDAGEVNYLPPNWRTAQPLSNPNHYTSLYANMAATFGRMIEVTMHRNHYVHLVARLVTVSRATQECTYLCQEVR